MKLPSLTVKRRPVKKGAFRTYFANIVRSKKQHRASTAAMPMPEVDGDVPNLGIARALVVILIIHVVAIAGIFAHSHWFEEPRREAEAKAAMAGFEPKRPPRVAEAAAQPAADDVSKYDVGRGDTWESIAAAHGVKVEALRERNPSVALNPGRILSIPPRTEVAEQPPEMALSGEGSVVPEQGTTVTHTTPRPRPATDDLRGGDMVATTAAGNAEVVRPKVKLPAETAQHTAEPVANTPRTQRGTPAATPASTTTTTQETASAATKYTVKQGDTFWKIAQSHKTTPEAIMKANGIRDAKKLKPGMTLRVP